MSDGEDAVDLVSKNSRRDRFKGAIARTKTKLTKKDKESTTTADDFLASGRGSISTGRPSISDTLSLVSDRPPTTQSHYHDAHENLHPPEPIAPPQPSPRRIVVPKIDVSNSQRYPSAQPVGTYEHTETSLLRPDYHAHNQSTSSLSKGRGRARGLSVQFTNTPPVVIGVGGDEAETPTIEVARAKARARSASPARNGGSPHTGARAWNKSPLDHIHRAGTSSPRHVPHQAPQPGHPPANGPSPAPFGGIKRIQTGSIGLTPSPMTESRQAMEKEFEMSMGLGSTSNSPATTISPAEPPLIHAPKPIHPPIAYPDVNEMPVQGLRREHGTKSLRNKFEAGEGQILKQSRQSMIAGRSNGESDENLPATRNLAPASSSNEEYFPPPPGPPPNQRPLHGGVPHPPPSTKPPPPPPPPTRKPVNGTFAPPDHSPPRIPPNAQYMPPPQPPPQRRPAEDDYTGWVADRTYNGNGRPVEALFPGTDASGKLAAFPGVDEVHENKAEKTKRRWFRRGS